MKPGGRRARARLRQARRSRGARRAGALRGAVRQGQLHAVGALRAAARDLAVPPGGGHLRLRQPGPAGDLLFTGLGGAVESAVITGMQAAGVLVGATPAGGLRRSEEPVAQAGVRAAAAIALDRLPRRWDSTEEDRTRRDGEADFLCCHSGRCSGSPSRLSGNPRGLQRSGPGAPARASTRRRYRTASTPPLVAAGATRGRPACQPAFASAGCVSPSRGFFNSLLRTASGVTMSLRVRRKGSFAGAPLALAPLLLLALPACQQGSPPRRCNP